MRPWAPPEELLRTSSSLPEDAFDSIAFEYVYDGGDFEGIVAGLSRDLGLERNKTKRLNMIVQEISTELEALIERHRKDLGALTADFRYKEDRYEDLIAQLRADLSDAKAQCVDLTSKLSAEREAYFGTQKQLQTQVIAHAELNTQLENERSLNIRFREESSKRIAELIDANRKLEARAQAAESEASSCAIELRERKLRFAMDRARFGANAILLFLSRRRVRDLKRGLMRWKLLTRNERARLDADAMANNLRLRLRSEFDDELEIVTSRLQGELVSQRRYIERLEASRDRIAEARYRVLDPSRNLAKPYALTRWKLAWKERKMMKLKESLDVLEKHSLEVANQLNLTKSTVAHGLLNLCKRVHQWFIQRAFSRWRSLVYVSNMGALSECMRGAWMEVKIAAKALRKTRVAAANLINNKRNRFIVNRVFDTWRLQVDQRKLRRVSEWPQLWRLAHLPTAPITLSNSALVPSVDAGRYSLIKKNGSTEALPIFRPGAIPQALSNLEAVENCAPRKSILFEPLNPPVSTYAAVDLVDAHPVLDANQSNGPSKDTIPSDLPPGGSVQERLEVAGLTRAALTAAVSAEEAESGDEVGVSDDLASPEQLQVAICGKRDADENITDDAPSPTPRSELILVATDPKTLGSSAASLRDVKHVDTDIRPGAPLPMNRITLGRDWRCDDDGDTGSAAEDLCSDSDEMSDEEVIIPMLKDASWYQPHSPVRTKTLAHSAPGIAKSLDTAIAQAKAAIDSAATRQIKSSASRSVLVPRTTANGPASPERVSGPKSDLILKMMSSPTYEAWAESVVNKKLALTKI